MTTASEALAAGLARLRVAGVPDPSRDARKLLAHALDIDPGRLTLALPEAIGTESLAQFDRNVTARAARQPVSQIVGSRLFWGRSFRVTSEVLDPRPETETLVATALQKPAARILDLGTGSGCILLTLLAELPDAHGTGTDVSATALAVAQDNARRLEVLDRSTFVLSDWMDAVEGSFDLIVSNPPYISAAEMEALDPDVRDWEPHMALSPGGDGLDAYRRILVDVDTVLAPGGRLLLEIGHLQGPDVLDLGARCGLTAGRMLTDFDGRNRVVSFSNRS